MVTLKMVQNTLWQSSKNLMTKLAVLSMAYTHTGFLKQVFSLKKKHEQACEQESERIL